MTQNDLASISTTQLNSCQAQIKPKITISQNSSKIVSLHSFFFNWHVSILIAQIFLIKSDSHS